MGNRRKVIKMLPLGGNDFMEVELYYSEGGMNYFNGESSNRGYYFSVRKIEKVNGCSSFMMFSGLKKFVKEANRFSQKTFDSLIVSEEDINMVIQAVAKKENILLPVPA